MRIFLIFILIFLMYTAPIYGIRPLNDSEIDKEKEKIAENMIPIREERENKLHPFVQLVSNRDSSSASIDNTNEPFRYRLKENVISQPKNNTYNSEPNRSAINFLFLFLVAFAFLLSYFFIRPKSK